MLSRRSFLAQSASAVGRTGETRAMRNAAVYVLVRNVRTLKQYRLPVLMEGSVYAGIWQECGPHEALEYASLVSANESPIPPLDVAIESHRIFFRNQRQHGQLPAWVRNEEIGFGQIQLVVPIAATAWEVAQRSGNKAFLREAYRACALWDAWLRQYRDTRKTGLVEGFCTYDTGQDNSPRWAGVPNACPEADASRCPSVASLPRLCPDLSATVYGARRALATMARALGLTRDAAAWDADAETIRRLIVERLYCREDAAFYDRDAQDRFVRVRSDVLTRVLGEHVLDPKRDASILESIWTRQLHNSKAFWAPYPFPSVALDDTRFVRPIPRNSWGGASQALTAFRASRWMPYYGKEREWRLLLRAWSSAIARQTQFCQQLDPLTGNFTRPDPGGYSPAALLFLQA